MKRRRFLKNLGIGLAGASLFPSVIFSQRRSDKPDMFGTAQKIYINEMSNSVNSPYLEVDEPSQLNIQLGDLEFSEDFLILNGRWVTKDKNAFSIPARKKDDMHYGTVLFARSDGNFSQVRAEFNFPETRCSHVGVVARAKLENGLPAYVAYAGRYYSEFFDEKPCIVLERRNPGNTISWLEHIPYNFENNREYVISITTRGSIPVNVSISVDEKEVISKSDYDAPESLQSPGLAGFGACYAGENSWAKFSDMIVSPGEIISYPDSPIFNLIQEGKDFDKYFFTLNREEKNSAIKEYGYNILGLLGFANKDLIEIELQRMVHPELGHFYTGSKKEIEYAASIGYALEGPALSLQESQGRLSNPLFRLLHKNSASHAFTTNIIEKEQLEKNYDYELENIVGFVNSLPVR